MSFLNLNDIIHNFEFVNTVCELVSNKLNISNDEVCFSITKSFLFDLCRENAELDFVNYETALRFVKVKLYL